MSEQGGTGRSTEARIERLEENLAFTDRNGEVLSEEIAELGRLVRRIENRVELVETRLDALETGPEDGPAEAGEQP